MKKFLVVLVATLLLTGAVGCNNANYNPASARPSDTIDGLDGI